MSKLSLGVQPTLPKLNGPAAQSLDAIVEHLRAGGFEAFKLVYLSQSWKEVGFASFEAWAESHPKYQLSRDDRRALIIELDGLGMTQRQIAASVGAGVATVNRAVVPNGTSPTPGHAQTQPAVVPNGSRQPQPPSVPEPIRKPEPDGFEKFVESVQTPESRHASQVAQLTVAAQGFALAVDHCDEPPTEEEAHLPSVTVTAALKRMNRGRKAGLEVVS